MKFNFTVNFGSELLPMCVSPFYGVFLFYLVRQIHKDFFLSLDHKRQNFLDFLDFQDRHFTKFAFFKLTWYQSSFDLDLDIGWYE